MREKIFKKLAAFICANPWKIIAVALVLTVLSAIAAMQIRLNTNLDELVSEKLEYHKRYIDFLKEFGDEEYMYVVVDGALDMAGAKKFVAELGERLPQIPGLSQVIWRMDNPVLEKNFLLYLDDNQIRTLTKLLSAGPFSVKNIASWRGLGDFFNAMAARIEEPVAAGDEKELTAGFTAISGLVENAVDAMSGRTFKEARLEPLFFGNADSFDPDGFLRNKDMLFVLVMPPKDYATMEVIEKPVKGVRAVMDELRPKYPLVNVGLTGRPVLSYDEITTANRDMNYAGALAFTLMAILFILSFRGIVRPMLAQATLGIGIAWTFGFVSIVFGTLNILSIVFAVVLVGAVMEYAFRFIARYHEELSAGGGDLNAAVQKTLCEVGIPDMTSAVTTAAVFLTLTWTDFTALAQLGIIAAFGIIICVSAILIVLPALLVVADRGKHVSKLAAVNPMQQEWVKKIYKHPWILLTVSASFTMVAILFAGRAGFDDNLLNLQPKGLESVRFEKLIIDRSSETTWFARSVAKDIEDGRIKAEKLSKLPSVRRVDDLSRILPVNQEEKKLLIEKLAGAFRGVNFLRAVTVASGAADFKKGLDRLESAVAKIMEKAFSSGRADVITELSTFDEKLKELAGLLDNPKPDELTSLEAKFLQDIRNSLSILAGGLNPTSVKLGDLPDEMVRRFVSPAGKIGLFIYPKEDIWQPFALARFVADIRSVDPNATGTPIEVYESGRLMRGTFFKTACAALIAILVFAWLDSRSVRATILAAMPLALGTTWLLGIMGALAIPFNMANFFAIPILIGVGIDFGVHTVHRLRQDRSFDALSSSTGRGLVLTAISNAAGFGALIIASHRGIASLGMIMLSGSLLTMLAAFIALPPAAKLMNWGNKKNVLRSGAPANQR